MKKKLFLSIVLLSFIGCKKTEKKVEIIPETKVEEKVLKQKSLNFALETKELLGKNLQEKIKEGGAENALNFCNINAIPLTKSISDKYKTNIKRVSDQPRNQLNTASEKEKKHINLFKERIAKGEELKPELVDNQLYVPIVTNAMCLQCHGNIEDNNPLLAAKIKKLYPEDKATGYSENQVRGIFVVDLPK
ncbi:hypothetical protein GCM10010992_06980 [Cloacibacterium rupense]|uniref:Tll0287-like domain-containing protein n=1 Tax=Cloacibacterium rupense TaxID=517423 RepID=A0ABQ2NHL7_9FLAO|nr:DUF3365 domain-containing protein [Cloacibacterium rupense]GGP02470.1 hypothetical protein GCM10010992_06980 [Cloacibacterium rupense]